MKLWVVRHAPVQAEGRCYGQSDVETLMDPDEVASRLTPRLAPLSCRTIWSSQAARCLEPALALGQRLGWTVRQSDQLAEIFYGEWEGRLWDEIEATDGERMHHWMKHWQTEAPPGGESLASLEARVRSFVSTLNEEALVFAHAGVVRALHVILGSEGWAQAMDRSIEHLELSGFEVPSPRSG